MNTVIYLMLASTRLTCTST